MSTFTETIRVSSLVRKYLSVHFETTPFVLSYRRDPFGAFLLNSLDRYPSKETFKDYQDLNDSLTVTFTKHQIEHQFYCQSFNQRKIIAFNDFVKKAFLQQAVREMAIRVETGEKINRAAELILARYKLTEEDLALETLVRYFKQNRHTAFAAR